MYQRTKLIQRGAIASTVKLLREGYDLSMLHENVVRDTKRLPHTDLDMLNQQNGLQLTKNGVNSIPKFAVWVHIWSSGSGVWALVIAVVDPSLQASFIEVKIPLTLSCRSEMLIEDAEIDGKERYFSLKRTQVFVSPDWSSSLARSGNATFTRVDFLVGNDGKLNKEYDVGLEWDYYWPIMSYSAEECKSSFVTQVSEHGAHLSDKHLV
jgi:hypothetical protein